MKRNLLSILVVLLPLVANAYDAKIGDIYYNFSGVEATVTSQKDYWMSNKGSAYSGDVVIPSSVSYNGTTYSVTGIGSYAFDDCSGLTSVTIPNSVTSIGSSAFSGCSGLTSVNIPNGVTKIDYYTFFHCSSLTTITIPNSVTSIVECAFIGCSGLTSVTIPNSVTSIGYSAFAFCSSLTSINIPNSVTNIGDGAFSGCSGLTSITIPNSVTSIGNDVFSDCSSLTSVTIPNSVTRISRFAFKECSGLTSVTIPNSVTSIGSYAFCGCSGLTSVTIGSGVQMIGYDGDRYYGYTFSNCQKLTDVYCYAETVPSTRNDAFEDSDIENATLHVPAGSVDKYKATAPWNGFGNIVALSNVDWQEEPIFNENKTFTVGNSSCTRIIYQGRIGYDFESALDSLTRKYEPILNVLEAEGHYSGEGLDINEEKINVDFNYDSREFKLLTFIDKANIYNYLFTTDVIDEKGNHYYFVICNDEPIVSFTKGQMATIILPTVPDADKGKYYRLDKCEDGKIIFEQEQQPRARVPYIIVPSEDFSIDPSTLDLEGLTQDAVSIEGISFIGTYTGEVLPSLGGEGSYYDIIDTTPDCTPLPGEGQGVRLYVGALRAYMLVNWDDPINHPGSKDPGEKLPIVLKDNGTSIEEIKNEKIKIKNEGSLYDFQGRRLSGKPERGIYIEDGKKKVMR